MITLQEAYGRFKDKGLQDKLRNAVVMQAPYVHVRREKEDLYSPNDGSLVDIMYTGRQFVDVYNAWAERVVTFHPASLVEVIAFSDEKQMNDVLYIFDMFEYGGGQKYTVALFSQL